MTNSWINAEDDFYKGAFRVDVGVEPEGVYLVRADDARQAVELAVEGLGVGVVDEAAERCSVTLALDVEAPGLRPIDVYPNCREVREDGEYPYEASYDGPAFRASVVGYSDYSEREAVDNLVGALAALGIAGSVRVCSSFVAEPVPLGRWRERDDDGEDGSEEGDA